MILGFEIRTAIDIVLATVSTEPGWGWSCLAGYHELCLAACSLRERDWVLTELLCEASINFVIRCTVLDHFTFNQVDQFKQMISHMLSQSVCQSDWIIQRGEQCWITLQSIKWTSLSMLDHSTINQVDHFKQMISHMLSQSVCQLIRLNYSARRTVTLWSSRTVLDHSSLQSILDHSSLQSINWINLSKWSVTCSVSMSINQSINKASKQASNYQSTSVHNTARLFLWKKKERWSSGLAQEVIVPTL